MASYLAVVVVLMTSSARAADEARFIKRITYACEIAPHEIGDADHTKLLDGKDDPVLWYPPPPRQNATNIDFDLGNTYRVTRVEVDADRSVGRLRLQNLKLLDKKGTWKIQLKDLTSGKQTEQSFRVSNGHGRIVL